MRPAKIAVGTVPLFSPVVLIASQVAKLGASSVLVFIDPVVKGGKRGSARSVCPLI